MVVAVAGGDPVPRGVEVGVVLVQVGDVRRGLVRAVSTGRTCAGRGRRSRSPGRATTARTRSGRSSRRTRGRRARPAASGPPPGARPGWRRRGPRRPGGTGSSRRSRARPGRRSSAGSRSRGDCGRTLVGVRRGRPDQAGQQPDVVGRLGVPLHRRPGTARRRRSNASSVPSSAAAAGTNPGWVRTDWWWWQLTVSRSPSRAATRVPGTVRTSTGPNASPPGLWPSCPARSGVCWSSDAARVDGHHLHAPAHAEHRQPDRVGRVEQGELPGVPVGAPPRRARVGLLAVARRVDVGAAGDDQAVEPGDERRPPSPAAPPAAAAPARRRSTRPRRRTGSGARRRAAARPPTRRPRGRSSARSAVPARQSGVT